MGLIKLGEENYTLITHNLAESLFRF